MCFVIILHLFDMINSSAFDCAIVCTIERLYEYVTSTCDQIHISTVGYGSIFNRTQAFNKLMKK